MADSPRPAPRFDYIGAALGVVTLGYIIDLWTHGGLTDAIRRFFATASTPAPNARDLPAGFLRDLYDDTRGGGDSEA